MRPVFLYLLAVLSLTYLFSCSARPQRVAPAEEVQCAGGVCDAMPWGDIRQVTPSGEGVLIDFDRGVERHQAVGTLFHCHEIVTDNPRLPTLRCPVNLGPFTLEVGEGPVGVTLMLRTDDARMAEAIGQWYDAHREGLRHLDADLLAP